MSISKGIARDYPLYEVRGFMLDVGRKTFELEYLYDLMEEMSWYKLNDFQLHLNDNYIFLEDYTAANLDPMDATSGFRLESSIVEGGNGGLNQLDLTSKDVYYTKAEYVDLVNESSKRGVVIVPEFDTPAHSLALTQVRPDLKQGSYARENDHLDLINNYQGCIDFVQSIFLEYMEGSDPVFPSGSIVHLVLDEYTASSQAFRTFSNDMIDFAQNKGYQPRIWGSLSSLSQGEEVLGDGVQMNLWNSTWANFQDMYDLGFDLINTNDGDYYIVPDAGYYFDYLDKSHIYTKNVNSLGGATIPAGDSQMLGGMFAVWNDQVDSRQNGTSEYDVYVRIKDAIPYFSAAVWGELTYTYDEMIQIVPTSNDVPNTNLAHNVPSSSSIVANYNLDGIMDSSSNGYDIIDTVNAPFVDENNKQVLQLNGGESYAKAPLDRIGVGNSVSMKVKRTSASTQEQILLESSNSTIKAVQKDTGKVGFSREGLDYSFNYTLPINTWVELEFVTEFEYTYLYVDGVLVDTLGDEYSSIGRTYFATLMLPIEIIGSKTNSFIGYIDEVTIQSESNHISTMPLERVIDNATAHLETTTDATIQQAVDVAKALIASNTYTKQQQLDDAIADIEEAIKNSNFEIADYSAIVSLMNSVLDDTNLYTKESYDNLLSIYNAIPQGLHISYQQIVDSSLIQLQKAINELVVESNMNLLEIDNATMKATSSSNQDDSSSASKAIDNDTSTMWHTTWVNTPPPHYIEIELSKVTAINKITYVTRTSGSTNGNIQDYNVEVSLDRTNYTRVNEGTLSTAHGSYDINFDAVDAKYVRINVISGVGGFGSAAEIDIYKANVTPDFDALQEVVDQATQLNSSSYTEDTWAILQDKINTASQLLNDVNASAQDVHNSMIELVAAMSGLSHLANYNEINELIDAVASLV